MGTGGFGAPLPIVATGARSATWGMESHGVILGVKPVLGLTSSDMHDPIGERSRDGFNAKRGIWGILCSPVCAEGMPQPQEQAARGLHPAQPWRCWSVLGWGLHVWGDDANQGPLPKSSLHGAPRLGTPSAPRHLSPACSLWKGHTGPQSPKNAWGRMPA